MAKFQVGDIVIANKKPIIKVLVTGISTSPAGKGFKGVTIESEDLQHFPITEMVTSWGEFAFDLWKPAEFSINDLLEALDVLERKL